MSTLKVDNIQDQAGTINLNTLTLNDHLTNPTATNLHTKANVGLGNVDNTADIDKPVSVAQQQFSAAMAIALG